MSRLWIAVALSGMVVSTTGCVFSVSDDGDTDGLDSENGSDSLDDTSDTMDDTSDTMDDSEGTDSDTALDGTGGVDEACYVGMNDSDEQVMWCDDELIASSCVDNADGCCCRAPCEPSVCPAVDSDEGDAYCLNIGMPDGAGVCSYAMDQASVDYECPETCVSRSECVASDEVTGECLDDPLPDPAMGLCLYYDSAPDVSYCMQLCVLSACDELHTCEAAQLGDGTFDGTGFCNPN